MAKLMNGYSFHPRLFAHSGDRPSERAFCNGKNISFRLPLAPNRRTKLRHQQRNRAVRRNIFLFAFIYVLLIFIAYSSVRI